VLTLDGAHGGGRSGGVTAVVSPPFAAQPTINSPAGTKREQLI